MRTSRAWLWAAVLGSAFVAALPGCAGCARTGATEGDDDRVALAFRTGEHCRDGCPLDRPMLVGTEERIEILHDGELPPLLVESSEPSVIAAWLERTTLCCAGAACRPLDPAERCAEQPATKTMIVVRALAEGDAQLRLLDPGGFVYDRTRLAVAKARDVVAMSALLPGGGASDTRVIGAASLDGVLERVELRVRTTTLLRVEAHSSEGELLQSAEGIGVRVDDPRVAWLSPDASGPEVGGLAWVSGPRFWVRPVAPGETTLTLAAAGATRTVSLVVREACDTTTPDVEWTNVACESDEDCVPASCCHAETCVAPEDAPDCRGVACTLECREGTLDCGGRCLCLNGRCAAHLAVIDDPSCPPIGTPHVPDPPDWFRPY